MAKERAVQQEHKMPVRRPKAQEPAAQPLPRRANKAADWQKSIGNRAVQRLVNQRAQIQRSGAMHSDGAFDLDDETAARINRERGGGQPLDDSTQAKLGAALGRDLGDVRVHTSPEADALNRQINAKAFTTGQDVFFREGAYEPQSSGGQELIAHELADVAQQSSGAVGNASRMTVNAPGDAFERQADTVADAVAQSVTSAAAPQVQRQQPEEEEETQAQSKSTSEMEEEESILQAATVQRQEEPEEEEIIQAQAAQRQEQEEEETW